MKKIITLLLICFSLIARGQELVRNEVDEFTKHIVKETSWMPLLPMTMQNVHFRVRKVDSTYFFDIKWMGGGIGVTSIREGDELMFKLENDEIISNKCLKFVVSCVGCGATGFAGSGAKGIAPTYVVTEDNVKKLLKNYVYKIRLYTSDGYIEKELKDKFSENIYQAFKLLQ